MARTPLPLFVALVAIASSPLVAKADDLTGELKYVPPDAAFFIHLDVAAIHDSKLGPSLEKSTAAKPILGLSDANALLGAKLADLKTVTFAFANLQDQADITKRISVVTFRKKYDREKLIAAIQEQAKKVKGDVVTKENMVTVTAPSPTESDKTVTTYDLTDGARVVTLHGLGKEYLKPSEVAGLHTPMLKANSASAAIVGVNINALPDEFKREDLPAEVRPFRPILMGDGLTVVGTLDNDKLRLSVAVKSKNKGDAVEVEKSLDALRQLADSLIKNAKKNVKTGQAKPKDMSALLDTFQAALKTVKFSLNDTTTTASASAPLDAPYGPFFDLLVGGGSDRTIASNYLKQLGLAMHNYHSALNTFPSPATLGKKGKKLISWRVEVLPYIDEVELYKKFKLDEAWDSEHNLKVFKDNPMPKVFAYPGSKNLEEKKTHYQVFVGSGAMFEPTGPTKLVDISDGLSNTIMIATAAKAVEWTKPDDIEFDPKAEISKLLLFIDGVTTVAFGDGSVRAIRETVAETSLKAMVTRSGGEVIGDDE